MGAVAAPAALTLAVEEVAAYYGAIQALRGVSVRVPPGSIVTILGANGAGKTTLLRTISGLVPAARGRIEFMGQRIDRLPPERIVELGIAQVPEGRQIFPQLTVTENLRMGAYRRRDRANVKDDRARVFALFPVLAQRQKQMAGTLSGGEQQMLAIGRAIMARPRLLLLDEPSLGLAPLVVRQIFKTVQDLNREGMTILMVEQNVHLALAIASYGYVLETGRVTLEGESHALRENEMVRRSYLGG